MAKMVACRRCAGTGEYPPTGGDTCSWCSGEGEIWCGHDSMDGIDQTEGPDKVWECSMCGVRFRFVRLDDGIDQMVEV